MTTARQLFYFKSASPASGRNNGPFAAGSINKLTRVRLRGALFSGINTINTSNTASNPVQIGFQWVLHGNAPLDIVANADAAQVLRTQQLASGPFLLVWAPSTDTAAYAEWQQLDLTWAGQLLIGNNVDFYYSSADPFASGNTWEEEGTLEIEYA